MVDLRITLPEGFLEEEVRCGYTVSQKMKEVWAVELDMLVKLLEVCKKYNIKIFASGGTMLGAVRHKGFIPWDDDIDMMMFREDYNKLCDVAQKEFEYPYFFQTEYTDPGSLRGHAQLRNSQTTGILKGEKAKFNQGIFLDIFPLDAVIDNEPLFAKQAFKASVYRKMAMRIGLLTYLYVPQTGLKGLVKGVLHSIVCTMEKYWKIEAFFYRKFENTCSQYNQYDTKMISSLSFQFRNKDHFKFRENYQELIEMPFEFLSIPVGKQYHEGLTKRYGNYSKIVMGTSCHGGVLFDADRPYTEHIDLSN